MIIIKSCLKWAASNMTTGQEVSQYLIDAGEASKAQVQQGKSGDRNVAIFQCKKYLYKGAGRINTRLLKSILPLYISMSSDTQNKSKQTDDKKQLCEVFN